MDNQNQQYSSFPRVVLGIFILGTALFLRRRQKR